MKTNYYLSQFFFEEFEKHKRRKQDFEYIKTTYSKKIKTKTQSSIFNPDGTGDDRILSLINKTRSDGKKYLEENPDKIEDTHIYFLDMFDIPKENEIIKKVDLTSAYWKKACLDKIVSDETNKYFNETFQDKTGKELKSIRLKALGALATRKEIETFEKGKSVFWDIYEEPTKPLYMQICRHIDNIMRECRQKVDGCVFYYWDCMFVREEYSKQVVDFFLSKQFECKEEETRLCYDIIGTKGYFTSECDGKMYMVQKENKHLLDNIK